MLTTFVFTPKTGSRIVCAVEPHAPILTFENGSHVIIGGCPIMLAKKCLPKMRAILRRLLPTILATYGGGIMIDTSANNPNAQLADVSVICTKNAEKIVQAAAQLTMALEGKESLAVEPNWGHVALGFATVDESGVISWSNRGPGLPDVWVASPIGNGPWKVIGPDQSVAYKTTSKIVLAKSCLVASEQTQLAIELSSKLKSKGVEGNAYEMVIRNGIVDSSSIDAFVASIQGTKE